MRFAAIFRASLLSVAALSMIAGCSDKPAEVASRGAGKPAAEIKVDSWGPQETQAGKPFNVQPTGKSALWIKVSGLNVSAGVQVLFGDKPLEDLYATNELVTAAIPSAMLEEPGDRVVALVEGGQNRKVTVGTFKVLPK